MSKINWRRIGYGLSFLVVAGTAAVASYTHIRDVALYGHQSELVAHLLPLSIDGMLLIASLAMSEDKANNRHPRWWARIGFWGGASVSTAANVAATVVAYGADPVGIAVAAVAPLMLLISIEIVSRPGKPRKGAPEAPQGAATEVRASDAQAEDLPEAPVSPAVPSAPAPAGKARKRGPYGPRDPERGYAPSTLRKQRAEAKQATQPVA